MAALVLAALRGAGFLGFEPGWLVASWPAQLHLFVYGWITELIIGVALWLFPVADRDNPRGATWLNYLAWGGITGGLVLRLVAEPWATPYASHSIWDWTLLVSAVVQCIGGLAFVINIWPRVKGRAR